MKHSNEQLRKLIRTICIGGVSTLTLGALSTPSYAADAGASAQNSDDLEEIVVTGIRASLQKSLDIKKESVGVVDAISSEDIGKFPDSNLAASMARIPGVTISRGSSMGSTTSTGDATSITVRGFGPSFNTTLFDGRQLASATGNRGFDYSAVGADFISAIRVQKTPDATLSSGAIGATINIINRLPFDKPGLQLAGSVSGTYASGEAKTTPNAGVLFSDTFADDTFGVLADVSYAETKTQGNHINIQGWEGTHMKDCQYVGGPACTGTSADTVDANPSWFIQDYGIYQEHNDDKRVSGRLALQWRPIENLLLTVNDDYSDDKIQQTQYGYSVWFNAGSLTKVVRNGNGTLTSFVQPNTPTDFQAAWNGHELVNQDLGFNIKWDATENTSYMLDYSNSVSKLKPINGLTSLDADIGYGPSAVNSAQTPLYGTDVGIAGVGSSALPYPTNYGPGALVAGVRQGDATRFIDPSLMGMHVFPLSAANNKDTINEFKLQGTWKADKLKVDYGFQYSANSEHLSGADDFQNNQWQAFAGYGSASNNYSNTAQPVGYVDANGNPLDASGNPAVTTNGVSNQYKWTVDANPMLNPNGHPFTAQQQQALFSNSFSTGSGFIHGFSNGNLLPAQILAANGFAIKNLLETLGNPYANGGSAANPTVNGFNYGSACAGTSTVKDGPCVPVPNSAGPVSSYNGTFALAPNIGGFQVIDEHTSAIFVNVSDKTELASMPLTVNAGFREERTTLTSQGIAQQPATLTIQPADHTAYLVGYTSPIPITKTNRYDYLLPNIDLNLDITDSLKARLDVSRTLTRPPLNLITPDTNVGQGQRVGALNASGGNPQLLPYLSDNLDLGMEWYYARNSYLAADVFVKNLTNFIVGGTVNQPINNVQLPNNGGTAIFSVTSQVNGPSSQISGLELGLQHTFGDSGFGFQANATFVTTDNPYNKLDLTTSGNAVTGLTNSWNFVGFFDKYGFQFRLAVNHQNEVLSQFGQQQPNSAFGAEPVYTDATTQWDASTSYDFNEHLSVYLEGQNLNNAVYSTHGRFSEQVLNVVDTGRRFTFGVHFKL
ncbi:MAG TPA: TonB-dependent receptor [Steroidobacteraceae bacterium]|nr:TonB-dependent receptor [Steroidobacteraceae bacterium]